MIHKEFLQSYIKEVENAQIKTYLMIYDFLHLNIFKHDAHRIKSNVDTKINVEKNIKYVYQCFKQTANGNNASIDCCFISKNNNEIMGEVEHFIFPKSLSDENFFGMVYPKLNCFGMIQLVSYEAFSIVLDILSIEKSMYFYCSDDDPFIDHDVFSQNQLHAVEDKIKYFRGLCKAKISYDCLLSKCFTEENTKIFFESDPS